MKTIKRTDLVYYRVTATAFIFLCHIFGNSGIPILQMSSQFFNVGVSMFLVLSGYLYGMSDIKKPVGKWYLNRWIRICVPEYLFVLILFVIHLAVSQPVKPLNWIVLLFNLQGIEIYVHGAEHLWYLTVLFFCYLITPLLDKRFNRNKRQDKLIVTVLLLIAVFSVVCAYRIHRHTAIYVIYVLLYITAFLLGRYGASFATQRNVILCLLAAAFFAVIRLAGKYLADGSTLYDVFLVGLTQGAIAFSLLFAVCSLKKLRTFKTLTWFDKISYEFYLVHYMFIIGPVSLMNLTPAAPVNWLIVAAASVASAWCINAVAGKVIAFLNRKVTA